MEDVKNLYREVKKYNSKNGVILDNITLTS